MDLRSPTPAPAIARPELRFVKRTLPNGLDVIALRQAHVPIVAMNLWYHVGSKDEQRGRRGFAHLFEHLMFEGSEHYPGDFFKPLQRLGAGINGSTSSDRTNYFVDLPAAHVELAAAMESDRMANLLPALDDRKLRVQKDVVKNEYRQNYTNRPYGRVWALLAEALYPAEHPYSWLTIGAMEDVEAATREDVESFFRRHYVPANASLCLVGDIGEDEAIGLAERYFGPIPGGAAGGRPRLPEVTLDADRDLTLHDRVELDRLYRLWPTVPQFAPDDAALMLVADVLARGRASRLYRRLVVELELAQDVSAYQGGRELAGSFGVIVTLRPGRDPAEARARVDAELDDLAARGPTDEELERARNGRVAGFLYALDNIGGFGGVADRLNAYNVYLGDPGRLTGDLDRFLSAGADDLRAAAARHLAGRPSLNLTVRGRSRTRTLPPLDRAIRPTPRAAVAYRAPVPEVRRLAGGAALWVIPRRDLPIVAATAVVPAGASAHGPERGGLAELTAALMDEGTTRRDAHALALAAERIGTVLSTGSGWDGSYVSLRCLTPYLAESLDLAADVLARPVFPESEWNRVRGQALAALRSARDSAENRAHRALLRALYPEGHPYRVPTDGDEATVAALGLDDLRRFHRARFGPGGAAWVAAGDVDAGRLAETLDGLLDDWREGDAGPPDVPAAEPSPRPRLVLVDRPGAAQAVLRIGMVGISRLDPDHDALLLWNQVLGGQFSARLNEELRERRGLTYGVRSHFDARRGAGPFVIGAAVQSDRVAEALDATQAEVAALLSDRPPTPEELDDARRALIEGQARHFETPPELVARYAGLFLLGLPPDHHTRLPDRLAAVGVDALRDVAARRIRPDALTAVVVADAELVAGPLERLGWAPVEIQRDADGA
jgi:zinc protease